VDRFTEPRPSLPPEERPVSLNQSPHCHPLSQSRLRRWGSPWKKEVSFSAMRKRLLQVPHFCNFPFGVHGPKGKSHRWFWKEINGRGSHHPICGTLYVTVCKTTK